MTRLPLPGSDDGVWGDILNDFLAKAHNADGSLKSSEISAAGAELSANKGQSNGYASLDSGGDVPVGQLGNAPTAADATTGTKGIVQLAGDLAGTAASPTVPGLAGKVSTSRQVIAGTGMTGGGDLSADRTLTATGVNRGAFATSTAYQANDIVTYNGVTYSANTGFTSGGSFNPANWTAFGPPDLYDYLKPSGAIRETIPRANTSLASVSALTSGTLLLSAIPMQAGEIITSVAIVAGTAMSAGSNQWVCIVDAGNNVLAKSDDHTNEAWGTDVSKTFTLTSPLTITTEGLYYVGLLVVASTPPTLRGTSSNGTTYGRAPKIAMTANTGLTTPASLGATITTPTSSGNRFYGITQ